MTSHWLYLGALGAECYEYFVEVPGGDYRSARAFIMGRDDVSLSSSPNGVIHRVLCKKGDECREYTVARTPSALAKPLGDINMPKDYICEYPSAAMSLFPLGSFYENILCGVRCVHFPYCYGQKGPVIFGDILEIRAELPHVTIDYRGGCRAFVCGPRLTFIFYTTCRTRKAAVAEILQVLRCVWYMQCVDMRRGTHTAPYRDWLRLCTDDFMDLKRQYEAAHALAQLSSSAQESPKKKSKKTPRGRFIGTSFHKKTRKFEAKIKVNGTVHYLGYHDTAEAGGRAYDAFVREHKLKRKTNFVA